MARLKRSNARKPLATGSLMSSAARYADGKIVAALRMNADADESGETTFVFELNENDMRRLCREFSRWLTADWKSTAHDKRTGPEVLRALADMLDASEV